MVVTAVGLNSQTGQIFSLLLDVKGQRGQKLEMEEAAIGNNDSKNNICLFLCIIFVNLKKINMVWCDVYSHVSSISIHWSGIIDNMERERILDII